MGSHASRRHPSRRAAENSSGSETIATRAFLDALRHIVRELRLSSIRAERALGLSGAQLFVLARLGEAPAASIAELAARTHTDASSVSVVVRRLVERGLVARNVASEDARRATLSLTRKGATLLDTAPLASQERLIAAFEDLPRTTRVGLARGLADLVGRMGVEGAPHLFFEEEPTRRGAVTPRPPGRARAKKARGAP